MQYLAGLVKDADSLDELHQYTAIVQTVANQFEQCSHNVLKTNNSRQDFELIIL